MVVHISVFVKNANDLFLSEFTNLGVRISERSSSSPPIRDLTITAAAAAAVCNDGAAAALLAVMDADEMTMVHLIARHLAFALVEQRFRVSRGAQFSCSHGDRKVLGFCLG
jgi:hypothetical protein